MKPAIEIRDALPIDWCRLAELMRPADAAEATAVTGLSPGKALLYSVEASGTARAALFNGEVAAIWGVAPLDIACGVGIVWMLTGEAVDKFPVAFLRCCRRELGKLRTQWSLLVNAIDARYRAALRWAKWLGFEVAVIAEPFGVAGLPFHRVSIEGAANG